MNETPVKLLNNIQILKKGINEDYKHFAAPFIFSEYGCKHYDQATQGFYRSFTQVAG
jgi:hypothetical protein